MGQPGQTTSMYLHISHALLMFVAQHIDNTHFFNALLSLRMAHRHQTHARSQDPAWHCTTTHDRYSMSIQSLRQHPIANVHCCAECFHPKGFQHAHMAEHGVLDTGEHPNCSFWYTIRHRVVWYWGCSLVHWACRCHAACPLIIHTHCPWWSPGSSSQTCSLLLP